MCPPFNFTLHFLLHTPLILYLRPYILFEPPFSVLSPLISQYPPLFHLEPHYQVPCIRLGPSHSILSYLIPFWTPLFRYETPSYCIMKHLTNRCETPIHIMKHLNMQYICCETLIHIMKHLNMQYICCETPYLMWNPLLVVNLFFLFYTIQYITPFRVPLPFMYHSVYVSSCFLDMKIVINKMHKN